MSLKENKGKKSNMYRFVSHIWNPVRGKCPYECSYCYVNKWGNIQKPLFFDRSFLKDKLGNERFIFICSGCDLFAPDVPIEWIMAVKEHTMQYPGNKYLWHTKSPLRLVELIEPGPPDIACVTIESNKGYPEISKAPHPIQRIDLLNEWDGKRMITVEPIMDFDLDLFGEMILDVHPMQVNIGADSGGNGLPEPPAWKVKALIEHLEKNNVAVHRKDNLARILASREAL